METAILPVQVTPDIRKKDVRVFLVDDDRTFIGALKHSISKGNIESLEIMTFKTGEECLENLQHYKPAVIILDYYLNSDLSDAMNGLQVLREIKKSCPATEVIILSSQDDIELAVNILKNGAYDYVAKGGSSFLKIRNLVKRVIDNIQLNECVNLSLAESLKTRTILEAITDILIVFSSDGKLKFVNKEGVDMLGIRYQENPETNLWKLFPSKKCGAHFTRKLFIPVVGGEKIFNYMTKLITQEGKQISVLISATSFMNPAGEQRILLLIRDITDRIQSEQQLKKREEELNEKKQELNTFFYRANHDLKGPVASIMGLIELAKKKGTESQCEEILKRIERSALRLDRILWDFIKIIHLAERKLELSKIDFESKVTEIIETITNQNNDINWKIKINNSLDFYSDNSLIDTILYNLLINAAQYRKPSPFNVSVGVDIENIKDGIKIVITDNGIGIEKQIQKDIFTIFFRGTAQSEGSGLGLHIVKNAVEKLGGKIMVQSEPGEGTIFTILLPGFNVNDESALTKFS